MSEKTITVSTGSAPRGFKLGKKLFFSLLILLVLLFLLNLYFSTRTFLKPITRDDPELLYALAEGSEMKVPLGRLYSFQWKEDDLMFHIRINSGGWRGPLISPIPRPGEFRVLCMGDSITMGLGVNDEETFPFQLERFLRQARPGRDITVINGGVYGYSSQQGINLLQKRFLAFRPRVVIWAYGWNDSSTDIFIRQRDAKLIPSAPGGPTPATWRDRLTQKVENLPLALAIAKYTVIFRVFLGIGKSMEALTEAQQSNRALPNPRLSASDFKNAHVPPAFFSQNLDRVYNLSRLHGFDLVLVSFYPTPGPYREILRDFSRSHGLTYLDFYQRFEAMRNSRIIETDPAYREEFERYRAHLKEHALEGDHMLSFTINGMHPNRIGHSIVASEIGAALLSRLPIIQEQGDDGTAPN